MLVWIPTPYANIDQFANKAEEIRNKKEEAKFWPPLKNHFSVCCVLNLVDHYPFWSQGCFHDLLDLLGLAKHNIF
jgi:hypothetical protein